MNEKNELIEQTDKQRNPYLARPEDFRPIKADESATSTRSVSGQEDVNFKAIPQPFTGRGTELPTEVDDAESQGRGQKTAIGRM